MSNALTVLSFCCSNGLVCRLSYTGGTLGTRLVYPYSIKQAQNGNQILFAWCFPDSRGERFIYSQVTEVTPEPIMAVEQGHMPVNDWLFSYKVPSLYSKGMVRDVTVRGANGDFVGTKTWQQASRDERLGELQRFLTGEQIQVQQPGQQQTQQPQQQQMQQGVPNQVPNQTYPQGTGQF